MSLEVNVTMPSEHTKWMQEALTLAKVASQHNEVPVGAVLVHKGEKVGAARNESCGTNDPTAHAEMLLLRRITQMSTYYLRDMTLYTTLEPCLMCLGAIIQCQVKRVVFGAYDPKRGALGSTMDVLQLPHIEWRPDVWGGILSEESSQLLHRFFQTKRQ